MGDMETKRYILRDSGIRDRLKVYLDTLELGGDDVLEVIVRPYKKNRSLAQNNLLWMWLTEIANFIREEYGAVMMEQMGSVPTPEDLKDYFQRQFLGFKAYPLPDIKYCAERVRGTSDLNTKEFSEFLNRIDIYAGSELGLKLSHPEDLYQEAMDRHENPPR